MERLLDLDAALAERNEDPPKVKFGGKVFELSVDLPISFVHCVGELIRAEAKGEAAKTDLERVEADEQAINAFEALVKEIAGERASEFMAVRPGLRTMRTFVLGLPKLYGVTAGESPASNGSSQNGSGRSRRTSRTSTRKKTS